MKQFVSLIKKNDKQLNEVLYRPVQRGIVIPTLEQVQKKERDVNELKVLYDEKFNAIDESETILSMYPKIRTKLEKTKNMNEKKVKKLKKDQKLVWDNIEKVRKLEKEVQVVESELEKAKEEMTRMRSLIDGENRRLKLEWEVLNQMFHNFHFLFPKENEYHQIYLSMGPSYQTWQQEMDIYEFLYKEVNEAFEMFEKAIGKLGTLTHNYRQYLDCQNQDGGLLGSLKNMSSSDDPINDGLGLAQTEEIRESGKLMKESYRKLYRVSHETHSQVFLEKKKLFSKLSGEVISLSSQNESYPKGCLIFGSSLVTLRMYSQKKGATKSVMGKLTNELDLKGSESLIKALKEEKEVVKEMVEFVEKKRLYVKQQFDELKVKCENIRENLILERKKIVIANKDLVDDVPRQVFDSPQVYYI